MSLTSYGKNLILASCGESFIMTESPLVSYTGGDPSASRFGGGNNRHVEQGFLGALNLLLQHAIASQTHLNILSFFHPLSVYKVESTRLPHRLPHQSDPISARPLSPALLLGSAVTGLCLTGG